MNAEQWARVKDLFHAALERESTQRSAFLDEACREDAALRAEVNRLLVAHAESTSFIEHSPVGSATMTGRVFGRYEVGRLIGVGGMGEVYAARDVELGRAVALKVATGGDADSHARLRREAQHASQLNHPHVCTIHEVGTADGQPFIAMEYVEGQRLSDLIPRDGLPIESVRRYGVHIADALAHAHRHGVIHRDLKTANVVVTPEGRAKVLDFGLAGRRSTVAADSVMAGTLSCMAPELLRGEPADDRSDIWALGVLLYEMAAGRRPFTGATGAELSAAILESPPAPLPARVPADLKRIIERCLARSPADRYQQAVDVRLALEATGAEPVAAVQRARGRRAVPALIVVLVLSAGTWRFIRPANAPAAVATSRRPAVAVMPFERAGAGQDESTAWMSSGVPSMLMTGLAQTHGLEIVSTERLHEALKRDSRPVEAARQAGAGMVVVGSIFRAGPEIRIDAQVDDLVSGRILAAHSVRGTDLFALVDQLASQIRDGIGFRNAADIRRVADVSTSSLEAYRLFALGVDAFTNTRMNEAENLLKEAVAIDPAFAEAYQQLATVMSFRGLFRARHEYLLKAAEHIDRLSERRRLILTVQLARDAGNVVEAERVLDTVLATFPDLEQSYAIASQMLAPRPGRPGNQQKLLAILSAGVTTLPTSPNLRNLLGYALAEAGRYAEAIHELEMYVSLSPREPNPFDSLGEGYLLAGAPDKAVDAYSQALAIDPTFSGGRDGRAWSLAELGRYDEAVIEKPFLPAVRAFIISRVGRHKEAMATIAAAVQETVRNDDPIERSWLLLASSQLAIERKEYARALQDAQSAEGLVSELSDEMKRSRLRLAALLRGVAQIGAGQVDAARATLNSQRKLGEPLGEVEKWWCKALEGEVALAGGDLEGAAAAFSAGEPSRRMWFALQQRSSTVLANNLTLRDGLARVAVARGDRAGAIQIYRHLLTYGPEQKWIAAFEPRYVLEIARLLEQDGNKTAAGKEYERFLELWKNADAGLPEPAEARRAVARLR